MMSLADLTTEITNKTNDMAANGKKVKIDLEGEGVILIDGTGDAMVVNNEDSDADVVLTISADNFQQLIDGDLNPQMAFMGGQLRIDGDMGLALQLSDMFS